MKYNLLVSRDGTWRRIGTAQGETAAECKRALAVQRDRWRLVDGYFNAAFRIEKEGVKWAK